MSNNPGDLIGKGIGLLKNLLSPNTRKKSQTTNNNTDDKSKSKDSVESTLQSQVTFTSDADNESVRSNLEGKNINELKFMEIRTLLKNKGHKYKKTDTKEKLLGILKTIVEEGAVNETHSSESSQPHTHFSEATPQSTVSTVHSHSNSRRSSVHKYGLRSSDAHYGLRSRDSSGSRTPQASHGSQNAQPLGRQSLTTGEVGHHIEDDYVYEHPVAVHQKRHRKSPGRPLNVRRLSGDQQRADSDDGDDAQDAGLDPHEHDQEEHRMETEEVVAAQEQEAYNALAAIAQIEQFEGAPLVQLAPLTKAESDLVLDAVTQSILDAATQDVSPPSGSIVSEATSDADEDGVDDQQSQSANEEEDEQQEQQSEGEAEDEEEQYFSADEDGEAEAEVAEGEPVNGDDAAEGEEQRDGSSEASDEPEGEVMDVDAEEEDGGEGEGSEEESAAGEMDQQEDEVDEDEGEVLVEGVEEEVEGSEVADGSSDEEEEDEQDEQQEEVVGDDDEEAEEEEEGESEGEEEEGEEESEGDDDEDEYYSSEEQQEEETPPMPRTSYTPGEVVELLSSDDEADAQPAAAPKSPAVASAAKSSAATPVVVVKSPAQQQPVTPAAVSATTAPSSAVAPTTAPAPQAPVASTAPLGATAAAALAAFGKLGTTFASLVAADASPEGGAAASAQRLSEMEYLALVQILERNKPQSLVTAAVAPAIAPSAAVATPATSVAPTTSSQRGVTFGTATAAEGRGKLALDTNFDGENSPRPAAGTPGPAANKPLSMPPRVSFAGPWLGSARTSPHLSPLERINGHKAHVSFAVDSQQPQESSALKFASRRIVTTPYSKTRINTPATAASVESTTSTNGVFRRVPTPHHSKAGNAFEEQEEVESPAALLDSADHMRAESSPLVETTLGAAAVASASSSGRKRSFFDSAADPRDSLGGSELPDFPASAAKRMSIESSRSSISTPFTMGRLSFSAAANSTPASGNQRLSLAEQPVILHAPVGSGVTSTFTANSSLSFNMGVASAAPASRIPTAGGVRASYLPKFKGSATRFSSFQAPIVADTVAVKASPGAVGQQGASLSYIQRRRLQRQSEGTASAVVAKKILETLGTLATNAEPDRKRPLALVWQDVAAEGAAEQKKLQLELQQAQQRPTPTKVALLSSSTSYAAPTAPLMPVPTEAAQPAAQGVKKIGFSNIPTFGAKAADDKLVSRIPQFGQKAAASAAVTASDAAKETRPAVATIQSFPASSSTASSRNVQEARSSSSSAMAVSDGEFVFEEPCDVAGVSDVGSALGKRSGELGASAIKYAFSPPNKTRKSAGGVASAATRTEEKPKAAETKVSATVPAAATTQASSSAAPSIWNTPVEGVKCTSCMVRNKLGATKCASCETPLVGANSSSVDSSTKAVQPAAPFTFGATSSTAAAVPAAAPAASASAVPNIWSASYLSEGVKCSACMARNKKDAVKCASCETPLIAAAPAAATPASAPASTISWGAPSVAATPAPPKVGFTFGQPAATDPKPAAAAATGFSFPAVSTSAAKVDVPTGGGFSFNLTSAATTATSTSATPSKIEGFSFAASAPVVAPAAAPAATATTSSGASKVTFGALTAAKAADEQEDDEEEDGHRSKRKAPTSTAEPAKLTFGFNAHPTSATAFGGFPALPVPVAAKQEEVKPPFAFGAFPAAPAASLTAEKTVVAPTAAAAESNSFSAPFGGFAASAANAAAPKAAANPFAFGAEVAAKPAVAEVPKPTASPFVFGAPPAALASIPEDKPFSFGGVASSSETSKTVTFGGPPAATAVPAPAATGSGFAFGAASSGSNETKAAPFTFGAAPVAPSPSPAPFAFGAVTAPAPVAAAPSPFMFGAGAAKPVAATAPVTANPFTFGGSTAPAATAASHQFDSASMDTGSNMGFPFGQQQASNSSSLPASNLLPPSSHPLPSFGGFNPAPGPFGAPGSATAAFGAAPQSQASNPFSSNAFGGAAGTSSSTSSTPSFGGFPPSSSSIAFGAPFGGAATAQQPFGGMGQQQQNQSSGSMFGGSSTPSFGAPPPAANFGGPANFAPSGAFGQQPQGAFGGPSPLNFGGGAFGSGNSGSNGNLAGMGGGSTGFSLGASDKKQGGATDGRRKVKVKRPGQ